MNEVKKEKVKTMQSLRSSSIGRLGFLVTGLGLGAVTAYLIAKRRRAVDEIAGPVREHVVDDRGTGQAKAAKLLRNLRDRGFEKSDAKLALALGRSTEEIEAFSAGSEVIDDDVIMKARGIAMHRGVRIE